MNAIKMVSWIHLLWGLSMIVLGMVPRPFGQLEAFLLLLDAMGYPVEVLGTIFVISGILAIATLHYASRFRRRPHVVPLALMPQQLLLTVGILFAIEQLLVNPDPRIWYAGVTQMTFGIFHAIGMYDLYRAVIIEAKFSERKSDQNA